jgi:hypothetical protein
MTRLICWCFGCASNEHNYCGRCGAAIYDYGFFQYGRLDWIKVPYLLATGWKHWFSHRCSECGNRMFFSWDDCCSEACWQVWIPF